MRVLLISHTCQSRTEGQPKAACLARLPGVELLVLTPDRWLHYGKWRPAEAPDNALFGFKISKVAWPWVGPAQFYLHWYPELSRILRDFRPDVIDLWEEPWGLLSAHTCSLRNRFLPDARIVSETEQNINKTLPFPFEPFRSYTLRNTNFAVGRNKEAVEILRSKGYQGPAEVVPNAVNADLFHPMDRAACRERLGLCGFVAGYIGRIVEEKGLMDMVDALEHCPSHVNLLFVGSGGFQTALEERAQELGRTSQVTFMPARPLDQLPEVMNAINALVLVSRTTASWKEQFGRVIIEANACKTPVIGSDSGAIPEVIGGAGLVVGERDPKQLARAILELDADPEACRMMGEVGREQVEAMYTWQRVAERMHSVYNTALG